MILNANESLEEPMSFIQKKMESCEDKFSDTSDSSTKSLSSKSKLRQYKQAYRNAWENSPDFKGWLQGVPGQPSKAFCKLCNKVLHAHRLTLLKHSCTIKHSKIAQKIFIEKNEVKDNSEIETLSVDPAVIAFNVPVDVEALVPVDVEALVPVDIPSEVEEPPAEVQAKKTDDSPVSAHVLDTAKGMPCAGLHLSLYKLVDGRWTHINDGTTNPVGRCEDLISREDLKPGRFKLHFDVQRYYELRNQDTMFPFVEIAFDVRSSSKNYHIPLLLSPYAFTTYREKL